MNSVSDLTTFTRKTTGDVPPKLVGASSTVIGNKMYLFGGRLPTERKMVSDLYEFDLETFVWTQVHPTADEDVPGPRYFHSADSWENKLVVFGGMGYTPNSSTADDLCVLNDVRFLDLTTKRWLADNTSPLDEHPENVYPRARYAHLSSVVDNLLYVIGGQDLDNVWLDDVHVYDMAACSWVLRREYPRHCGTYRSVAVSAQTRVRLPAQEPRSPPLPGSDARFTRDGDRLNRTAPETLVHLPYSTDSRNSNNDILLYSNYNFTDVKRELEVFSPRSPGPDFTVTDRSSSMGGSSLPPGLRFPTGAILGTHLLIAGTYLAHSFQSYSIWALDLSNMTWSRIDPGSLMNTGSWSRGALWSGANKFIIFGNRHGNLVEDYNRRLLSWGHVAVIDLEAFGIYQPPMQLLEIPSQELGLAALEEGAFADFEVVCEDGRRIPCSRRLLEERWPWFREQRVAYLERAHAALEGLPPSHSDVPLPIPAGITEDTRPDPRLTPRALQLSEPYTVALAFLQYFYTLNLITPLQHAPPVLSQLLMLSACYKLKHLEEVTKHAMHHALVHSTSVGIYEVATLCDCQSLQIRALKVVMQSSARRSPRARENGSGGNAAALNYMNARSPQDYAQPPGVMNSTSAIPQNNAARPRGMSDAMYRGGALQGQGPGSVGGAGANRSRMSTVGRFNVVNGS